MAIRLTPQQIGQMFETGFGAPYRPAPRLFRPETVEEPVARSTAAAALNYQPPPAATPPMPVQPPMPPPAGLDAGKAASMARVLQDGWQPSAKPLSWGQGLADALRSGIRGGFTRKLGADEAAKKSARADAMAKLLLGDAAPDDPRRAAITQWLSENPAALDSVAARKMFPEPTEQWSEATMGGMPGQVSSLTGKFDPFPRAAAGEGGVFAGTAMDAQDSNIILSGDPASPEYAMAYTRQYLTPKLTPSTDANGNPVMVPMMPAIPVGIRPPAGMAPATEAAPTEAPAVGDAGGPPSAVPQSVSGPTAGTPIPTGGPPKLTEAQVRNRQLYSVAAPELSIVNQTFDETAKLGNQAGGMLPADINSFVTSPGYQRAFNSLQTIIASYLYSTSGATANPAEVVKQTQVLMPKPGESAESIADKKARVETMVNAIKVGGMVSPPAEPQAPPPPTGDQPREGQTATNPQTGQKLIFQNGAWAPVQ